ncbi:hypothetical protein [Ferruginibacter sp.]
MNKKITEHDALRGIDDFFGGLSTEERQRVFDWIVLKYKIQSTTNIQSATSPNLGSANPLGANITGSNTSGIPVTTSIKDFLVQKKPHDNAEKIACIVYFLEKVQGLDGVKNMDIIQGNKDGRQPSFSNASVFINHAISRQHFLTSIGGSKKALSAKGEAIVNALPEREAVSKALAEHASKKKTAKKSTKKKKAK